MGRTVISRIAKCARYDTNHITASVNDRRLLARPEAKSPVGHLGQAIRIEDGHAPPADLNDSFTLQGLQRCRDDLAHRAGGVRKLVLRPRDDRAGADAALQIGYARSRGWRWRRADGPSQTRGCCRSGEPAGAPWTPPGPSLRRVEVRTWPAPRGARRRAAAARWPREREGSGRRPAAARNARGIGEAFLAAYPQSV